VTSWRDVTMLHLDDVKADISEEYFRRARHVISEIVRFACTVSRMLDCRCTRTIPWSS
jgi:hypothetical protein